MSATLGVVIGDPGGIGPEVCVKALARGDFDGTVARVVLIGSIDALRIAAKLADCRLTFQRVDAPAGASEPASIAVIDDGAIAAADITLGKPSKIAGDAVIGWIRTGIALAESGDIDALIIAPIDTTSFKLAEIDVEPYFEPSDILILRQTGRLRTVPIAEHILIRNVPKMVTKARVLEVIETVAAALRRWGTPEPRIAVAGLNPHCAGEEDAQEIAPAVAAARERGIDALGPYSPDTIFRRGVSGDFDVIVTMYHDQGQIAVKTIGLEDACSIFIGLPYVRVGIPHGSAMDIAGQNKANGQTALVAMQTAVRLAAGGGL